MGKVSVYIPAYNSGEFLSRAIDGLLAQTLPANEILVIDDGSRDGTAEIAASYSAVTLVRHALSPAETDALVAEMQRHFEALDDVLAKGIFKVSGQVPNGVDVIGRIRSWLAARSGPTAIAQSPRAR